MSGSPPLMQAEFEEDDECMNREAVERLPEHVVSDLKKKCETNDTVLALLYALNDESEHGKGVLASLIEVGSPSAADGAVGDGDKPSSLVDVPSGKSRIKCQQRTIHLLLLLLKIQCQIIFEDIEAVKEDKDESQTKEIKRNP